MPPNMDAASWLFETSLDPFLITDSQIITQVNPRPGPP